MFANQYYTLVAGLRDYWLDSDAKGFDAAAIEAEIVENLASSDVANLRLLKSYYDCENLINLHNGSLAFNPMGNIPAEEIDAELNAPERVGGRMHTVLCAYAAPDSEAAETVDVSRPFAKMLLEAYYGQCAASSCRFLREWSDADRTLRNVLSAVMARRTQRPIEDVTVGEGEIVEQLQRSSAADFGLRGEVTYIDALIAAVEEQNILEKERKIDLVRWDILESLTEFDYFNINIVLAYVVKLAMVARWCRLDRKTGEEMLAKLRTELLDTEMINKL